MDLSLYSRFLSSVKSVPMPKLNDFNFGILELEHGSNKRPPNFLPLNYFHIFEHE